MRISCLFGLAAALFGAASAYDNGPMGARPPMGWNTWSTDDLAGLIDYCTEWEVLSVASAMASNGLRDLGYNVIELDDCWAAKTRDAAGNLRGNELLFPSGMKALADKVHALGMRLGLYTCAGTHTCKRGRPGSYGNFDRDAATFASWGVDMVA
jgi:alpha-galactosidase